MQKEPGGAVHVFENTRLLGSGVEGGEGTEVEAVHPIAVVC